MRTGVRLSYEQQPFPGRAGAATRRYPNSESLWRGGGGSEGCRLPGTDGPGLFCTPRHARGAPSPPHKAPLRTVLSVLGESTSRDRPHEHNKAARMLRGVSQELLPPCSDRTRGNAHMPIAAGSPATRTRMPRRLALGTQGPAGTTCLGGEKGLPGLCRPDVAKQGLMVRRQASATSASL
jgi:hypothetical protein